MLQWRERFRFYSEDSRLFALDKALAADVGESARIDLRANELPLESLDILVPMLRAKPGVKACVGLNNFYFSAFYNKLRDMDALDLHDNERLTLGWEDQEKDVERLAARAHRDDRVLQLTDAINAMRAAHNEQFEQRQVDFNNEMVAFAALRKTVSDTSNTVNACSEDVKKLARWGRSQTDAYEELITGVVRRWLLGDDGAAVAGGEKEDEQVAKQPDNLVSDLSRAHLEIFDVPPSFPRGVEWDGALCAVAGDGRRTLYLIEAKTSIVSGDITDMPERLERTAKFMELLSDPSWPPKGSTRGVLQRCDAWRKFVLDVRSPPIGVIGGHDFTDVMLTKARNLGLVIVYPSHGAFHVVVGKEEVMVDAPTDI